MRIPDSRAGRAGRISRISRISRAMTAVLGVMLAIVLARPAAPAHGQARIDAGCTYDTCSLRVRAATFTRPPILVRGVEEEEMAPLTPFGDPVAPYFQAVDSAYAQALRYDRISPTAGVLSIAGPALLILGPFLTNWRERPIASFSLLGGGLGMTLYGTHLTNVASDALNRAIWWYNRELGPQR
jgi:hypothetical protein